VPRGLTNVIRWLVDFDSYFTHTPEHFRLLWFFAWFRHNLTASPVPIPF
jgi:hypothetical protein